jgi:hypothetical protein
LAPLPAERLPGFSRIPGLIQPEAAEMEVDIILEPDLTPRQVAELGVEAEKYGIRALWTSNFFAHWDAFLSAATLAEKPRDC